MHYILWHLWHTYYYFDFIHENVQELSDSQSHTAVKWSGLDLNPGLSQPEASSYITSNTTAIHHQVLLCSIDHLLWKPRAEPISPFCPLWFSLLWGDASSSSLLVLESLQLKCQSEAHHVINEHLLPCLHSLKVFHNIHSTNYLEMEMGQITDLCIIFVRVKLHASWFLKFSLLLQSIKDYFRVFRIWTLFA